MIKDVVRLKWEAEFVADGITPGFTPRYAHPPRLGARQTAVPRR